MQWCDRLSLILALQQIPTRERSLEISKGPDGVRYDVMQHVDGTLIVTPWPFQDDLFIVRCEATYLTQLSFKSNEEFVKALQNGGSQGIMLDVQQTGQRLDSGGDRRALSPGRNVNTFNIILKNKCE